MSPKHAHATLFTRPVLIHSSCVSACDNNYGCFLRHWWEHCRASALGTEGVCVTEVGLVEAAREALPFQLTGGQERALDNVLRDMQGPLPMMCLLQVQKTKSYLAPFQLLSFLQCGS